MKGLTLYKKVMQKLELKSQKLLIQSQNHNAIHTMIHDEWGTGQLVPLLPAAYLVHLCCSVGRVALVLVSRASIPLRSRRLLLLAS